MKVRKDFVTNSSSSSYICEICGVAEGGYDIGLADVDMVECKNGHVFCEHEMLKPTREKLLEIMEKTVSESKYYHKQWYDDDGLERLMSLYLSAYDGRYELDESMCPVCQMQVLTDSDFMRYMSKKFGISQNDVAKEIKEQFGSYKEFQSWLRGK